MDAQQFLAEFGHIANAPGGVVRLRELILQLAIQGKLINSGVAIESSQSSLASLKVIKAQLITEKKLPREKPYPEISVAELPTDRPLHWEWARFGEVWQLLSGRDLENNQYNGSKNGIPYITGASNIENGVINVNRWTDQPVVISVVNDLLITCKGTIGKTVFNKIGEMHIARQIMAIRNFSEKMDTGFLKIWLDGFVSQLVEKSKSMIPGFSREDLIYAIYPLPPLEEQARIVAKVDEMMALCDKLESQQLEREKQRYITGATVLESLSSAQSPSELLSAWSRLQTEANLLLVGEGAVQLLRKTILDLAVSGRLSQRQPNDGNVVDLVDQIQVNKKNLIANGQINRRKPVASEVLQETILPLHWTTLTLDEAIGHIDAGWSPACLAHPRRDENTWGILKTTAVQTLQFLPNEHKELPNSLQPRPQYEVHAGDILIPRAGPKNRVGICCVVEQTPARLMISDKIIRFHIVDDLIDARYVALCLSAGEPGRILERQKSGMAESQMNISQDKLRAIPIPLPPRAEQERILVNVERLMSICAQLSEQLKLKEKLHSKFAESSIATITGIRTEEEEALKTPKTELISKLRLVNNPDIKEQAPLAAILARHHDEMPANDLWQRYGGDIDAFYAQLKLEVGKGWIEEPAIAEMRETEAG